MSQPTPNPVARRSRWLRWSALAAVVLVPLAFAGLFVGALSQSGSALDRIPAAIVNEDSLVTTTAADGTEQMVFAGRQLVTELTGAKSEGFDWAITNAADAEKALKEGTVYAVLTVPSDFSKSILSLQSDAPQQADITVRTDDSHSYLTGAVVQAVGQSMVSTFGQAITQQYLGGIYASLGELGTSLTSAADGATQLANGATQLSSGLGQYTGGVDSLSSGLQQLSSGASGLSDLSDGVANYTGGVAQLSATLSSINAGLQANETLTPTEKYTLQAVVDGLGSAAAGGSALSQQTAAALNGIQGGIAQSADGASQLSAGSAALVSGSGSLASGATDLATGLTAGAGLVPAVDQEASARSAEVASNPVTLSVTTENKVSDLGQAIATFFVPLGLWIGALAVFLVLRPVTKRVLASTARGSRLVFSALAKASIVTGAQALLLVALLHLTLGVSWAMLPATIGFSLVMALAFTAFHYMLTVWLGRAGLIVSLFLLAVQITATGGIYPLEVLASPFQVVSPFLPLTYGVSGMQAIISGAGAGSAVLATVVLLLFGVVSTLLALGAIRRTRRATALGLAPATA